MNRVTDLPSTMVQKANRVASNDNETEIEQRVKLVRDRLCLIPSHSFVDPVVQKEFEKAMISGVGGSSMAHTTKPFCILWFVYLQFGPPRFVLDGTTYKLVVMAIFKVLCFVPVVIALYKRAHYNKLVQSDELLAYDGIRKQYCRCMLGLFPMVLWANYHMCVQDLEQAHSEADNGRFEIVRNGWLAQTMVVAVFVFTNCTTPHTTKIANYYMYLCTVLMICWMLAVAVTARLRFNVDAKRKDMDISIPLCLLFFWVGSMIVLIIKKRNLQETSLGLFKLTFKNGQRSKQLERRLKDTRKTQNISSLVKEVNGGMVKRLVHGLFSQDRNDSDLAGVQVKEFLELAGRFTKLTHGGQKSSSPSARSRRVEGNLNQLTNLAPGQVAEEQGVAAEDEDIAQKEHQREIMELAAAKRGLEVPVTIICQQ